VSVAIGSFAGMATALRLLADRVCAPVAGLCLFLMMALTFAEVVGRYFLNAPVSGVEEIKSFLLGFTIFTALSLVTRQQRHIAVRSLASLLRGRAALVQRGFVLAATFVGLGFIAYLLFDQARTLGEEGTLTNFLDLPLAPSVYVFAGLALAAAVMALELLARLVAGAEDGPDPSGPAGPE
jgi:TRAP-type C4-dicarboxylate transport system permease small subunit